MKKHFCAIALCVIASCGTAAGQKIDRRALVERNNPQVNSLDTLASLSVGNGEFAFTTDATGLQTFPEYYSNGVPLGTQSQWGWHSFPNTEQLSTEQTLKDYDFGRERKEPYAVEFKEQGTQRRASEYFRKNPHRLHLGCIGLELDGGARPSDITGISNSLDMWQGIIRSSFIYKGVNYKVQTVCHPAFDMVSASIESKKAATVNFRFAYPTGGHCDDGCDWKSNGRHETLLMKSASNSAVLKRTLDGTTYYVILNWQGKATLRQKARNYYVLVPETNRISFSCRFAEDCQQCALPTFGETAKASEEAWEDFWTKGAAVDFSHCQNARARELERRVVLSQYLLAIQCAGSTPPQETGLTYNSWFGKFHLEMIWWHQAWFPLWGHAEKLDKTLSWYFSAMDNATAIARRQGFDGVRWMKMTDPSALEAPSKVGSFLIWQQPHPIYLAELLRRANPDGGTVSKYKTIVQETARFMYSFATPDPANGRYVLKGIIPAQETLRAAETVNPPMELSYWHYAMQVAQKWRELDGQGRVKAWDGLIDSLSTLAANSDGLYLAAESATDTYSDIRFTSDHPAVLGAVGILPMNRLVDKKCMSNTLNWVWNNWNWNKTWGWDYPMTAMCAARLGEPDKAIGALLMPNRTNTYLVNGHNYQDERLRIYLPGNGGLLTAVAMMCAGWDGCTERNPGFPKDGNWDVRWEGLLPMP